MDNFSRTKLVIEVEIITQFGPRGAMDLVRDFLGPKTYHSAVQSLKFLSAETNYRLHQEPAKEMLPVSAEELNVHNG